MKYVLYFCISTSRSTCICAVHNMALFCRSLILCFPVMLLRYRFEWFWDGSIRPCYYRYHFCFYMPHALYFYCKVFIFYNILVFSLDHISVSRNCSIYQHAFSFFIITVYDFRIITIIIIILWHYSPMLTLTSLMDFSHFLTCLSSF